MGNNPNDRLLTNSGSVADPQQEKLLDALKDIASTTGARQVSYNKSKDGVSWYVGNNPEEAARIYNKLPTAKRKERNQLISFIGDQLAKLRGFITVHWKI